MGTNGIVIRSIEPSTYQFLYFSYDGYLSHTGRTLHVAYQTPAAVDALFAVCGDGMTLTENPQHLDIRTANLMFTDFPMNAVDRDNIQKVVAYMAPPAGNPIVQDIENCCLYFYHNAAWHVVPTIEAFDAIEKGDTQFQITADRLKAWAGLKDADLVPEPEDALAWNERKGILRVDEEGGAFLEIEDEVWDIYWNSDAVAHQILPSSTKK